MKNISSDGDNRQDDSWEPEYPSLTEAFELISSKIDQTMDLTPTATMLAALYVCLSWVYDKFPQIPILRALGPFETGKTRLIRDVLGPVLYRVFPVSGSASEAFVRREMISKHREGFATLLCDDVAFDVGVRSGLSDTLNSRCTSGGIAEILLIGGKRGWGPMRAVVFGATVFGGRVKFDDMAVESRILDIDMSAQERRNRDLPDPPWKSDEEKPVIELLEQFRSELTDKPKKLPRPDDIADRVWDVASPLVWLDYIIKGEGDSLLDYLREQSDLMRTDKQEEPIALVIAAIVGLSAEEDEWGRITLPDEPPSIALAAIRNQIWQIKRISISSHAIGSLLRSIKGLEIFISSGQSKVRGIDWAILQQVGKRFGYVDEVLDRKVADMGEETSTS